MQGILTGLCEQVRSLSDQKKGPLVYTPIGSTSIGSDETVTEQALGGGIYDVMWVPDVLWLVHIVLSLP